METPNTTTADLDNFYGELKKYQASFVDAQKNELTTLLNKKLIQLQEVPFPHRKQEDWKYTNIKKKLLANYRLDKLPGKMSKVVLKEIPQDFHHFVFINGKLSKLLSNNTKAIKFIHLDPLDDAYFIEPGSIHFQASNNFCDLLNISTLREGIQIHITKDNAPTKPIAISHFFTAECKHNIISPRIAISLDTNMALDVFEQFQYKGLQDSPFTLNNVTELRLEAGAKLEYVQLQNTTTPTLHFNTIKGNLYRDAHVNITNLTYGGEVSRNNFCINLQEEGATAILNGLYNLKDGQHSDQFVEINHNAPHTDSHQLFKGVLDDNSHGVFTGKVYIKKYSLQANSTQTNKNLLLSPKAHIDTRPQLEIYADDVKCTHGATIGQLNDEEIFYLETRGINQKRAKEMVATGFGEDVLFKIQNEQIRDVAKSLL